MAAAATLKVAGIFPTREWLETEGVKRRERLATNVEQKYQKLRAKIIQRTCGMAEEVILEEKTKNDAIKPAMPAEKYWLAKKNADQAKREGTANMINVVRKGLDCLEEAPFVGDLFKLVRKLFASVCSALYSVISSSGKKSDERLKRLSQKEEFGLLYDMYKDVVQFFERNKDVIMWKINTLSKKDYKKFEENYIAEIEDRLLKKYAKTTGQDGEQRA